MITQRRIFFFASLTLITSPVLFFFNFDSRTISSSSFSNLILFFFIFSIYFFLSSSLTDPGFIRKRFEPENFCGDFHADHISETFNGHVFLRKWCPSCHLYRPLRARHCRECDNCVYRFDHHCPWIDNCVGARNHRSFILFIASTATLSFLLLISILEVCSIENKTGLFEDYLEAMFTYPHRYFVLVLSSLTCMFLTHLTWYHLNLIGSNLTTLEDLKKCFPSKSPFSTGFRSNCLIFWFTPTPDQTNIEMNVLNE